MGAIRSRFTKLAAALAVILISTSCGGLFQGAGMHPTITEQQAKQRAHHYIMDAMDAIGMGHLEVISTETYSCTHPTDNGPQGRVQPGGSYFIRGVPREKNPQVFQAFLTWLHHNNFRILQDKQDPERFLWAENNEDSFRMTLKESSDGSEFLSISVTSPCVWPNGTPDPKSN